MSQKVISINKIKSNVGLAEILDNIKQMSESGYLKNMLIVYEGVDDKINYHTDTECDPLKILGFLTHVTLSIHANEFYVVEK